MSALRILSQDILFIEESLCSEPRPVLEFSNVADFVNHLSLRLFGLFLHSFDDVFGDVDVGDEFALLPDRMRINAISEEAVLHVVQLVGEFRIAAADHEDFVFRLDVFDEVLVQFHVGAIPLEGVFSFVEKVGPVVFLGEIGPTLRQ